METMFATEKVLLALILGINIAVVCSALTQHSLSVGKPIVHPNWLHVASANGDPLLPDERQ
jgi:hypothetical protein